MWELFIILVALYVEVKFDEHQFERIGKVTHSRGILWRVFINIILLIFFHWTVIFAMVGIYLLCFDYLMGLIVADDMMHMGTETRYDRVVSKIPPLPRMALRIILSLTLVSIYYTPSQWMNLILELTK